MINLTSTVWHHRWICAKLLSALPTIVSAVSRQISKQWVVRQVTSQCYYKDSLTLQIPERVLESQGAESHTLRNANLRQGKWSRFISYPLEFKFTIQAFQTQPWSVLPSGRNRFVHWNCPRGNSSHCTGLFGTISLTKALLSITGLFTGLPLPCEKPEWPLKPHVLFLSLVSCVQVVEPL